MQSKSIDIDMGSIADHVGNANAVRTEIFKRGRMEITTARELTLPEPAPSLRRKRESRIKRIWRRKGRLSSPRLFTFAVFLVLVGVIFILNVGFDFHHIDHKKRPAYTLSDGKQGIMKEDIEWENGRASRSVKEIISEMELT